MNGTAQVIQGNALALPLPDASVDLICTSPPYFGLRSYQDAGQHYEGQIGSEATPTEFLNALIAATREMVRVLKPSGSIFVNLGDKYAGSGGGGVGSSDGLTGRHDRPPRFDVGIPTKSLMGIPWRYAIACIDQLGLILRAEIIWAKPNGLPESVQDRVRRSHEQWFHMVKQPRYFAAVDEIREPHTGNSHGGGQSTTGRTDGVSRDRGYQSEVLNFNPLGKLPGSVWTIPSQPLTVPEYLGVDHFAAYPMEWPRRIIQGWTPTGICTACGEGRRPISAKDYLSMAAGYDSKGRWGLKGQQNDTPLPVRMGDGSQVTITGYTCGCAEQTPRPLHSDRGLSPREANPRFQDDYIPPTQPAVCVDPFGGTGTTALVAKALGRIGITIDLSSDYCRLAQWRVNDPRELAAALQVEKPETVPADQLSLFETP